MWLDVVGGPQPLNARCRDADRARHRATAPAPEIGRRRHGALQYLLGRPFRQPRLAATPRRIAQSGQPVGRKPPDPAINLQTRYAQAFGDLLLGQSLSAQQDDLRAPAIADRDRARARPAPQLLSLLRLQFDARPSHDCLPPRPANDITTSQSLQSYFRYTTLDVATESTRYDCVGVLRLVVLQLERSRSPPPHPC